MQIHTYIHTYRPGCDNDSTERHTTVMQKYAGGLIAASAVAVSGSKCGDWTVCPFAISDEEGEVIEDLLGPAVSTRNCYQVGDLAVNMKISTMSSF